MRHCSSAIPILLFSGKGILTLAISHTSSWTVMRKDDLRDAYHSDPSLNLLVRRRLYSGWIWLWLGSRSTTSTGKDEGRGEFNKQIQSPNHPPLRSSSSSCLVWINHSQRWMAFNVPVGPFINLRLAISCVWNGTQSQEKSDRWSSFSSTTSRSPSRSVCSIDLLFGGQRSI